MSESQCWDLRAQGKEAEIDIFGIVGDPGIMGESNTAADFMRAVRGIGKSVNRLIINIHSPGGSVFDGLAMYRTLRDWQGEKIARVQSLAASIATVFPLAADTVEVGPETNWMIHNPEILAMGGEKDIESALAQLRNGKKHILDIYARRTGGDREHLSELMDAETWFVGDEIKAAGFADIVKKDQPKRRLAAQLTPEMVARWRHAPAALLKPKPSTLNPDLAARLAKLKETA
jgi:ATP-dependent protease ClpP protease subunit